MFSPVLIALSGGGFSLTDAQHGVIFDLQGSGRPGRFAWTAPNVETAFLALDRNRNGRIDDGTELFGSVTPQPLPVAPNKVNGFAALAVFDANGDGQITTADPIFYELVLWRDLNHNGTTDAGELLTLSQAGIESIDLKYHESRHQDEFGNVFRYRAKVTYDRSHGKATRQAYDVFLLGAGGVSTTAR